MTNTRNNKILYYIIILMILFNYLRNLITFEVQHKVDLLGPYAKMNKNLYFFKFNYNKNK